MKHICTRSLTSLLFAESALTASLMYHIYMKLIVGLGNPGEKYQNNRHNIGFVVLNKLVEQVKSEEFKVESKFFSEISRNADRIYVKPITFMNESGRAVSAISRFYKLKSDEIFIVHDDLDIPLGKYKIQHGKGPQIHNGLLSVERELGTHQYWNVRVGVENREIKGNKGVPGMVYSLQDFAKQEQEIVSRVVVELVADLLTRLA